MLSSWLASASEVATISLPSRWCGTPRAAQYSYSRCLPRTHRRALRLSAG
ncbi:Uncharacterised protein [Bordetella pertussis]|nr:Uncharacterised protein [Bordetella pertussis]